MPAGPECIRLLRRPNPADWMGCGDSFLATSRSAGGTGGGVRKTDTPHAMNCYPRRSLCPTNLIPSQSRLLGDGRPVADKTLSTPCRWGTRLGPVGVGAAAYGRSCRSAVKLLRARVVVRSKSAAGKYRA